LIAKGRNAFSQISPKALESTDLRPHQLPSQRRNQKVMGKLRLPAIAKEPIHSQKWYQLKY
jgi:hypothetical protein